MKILVVSLTFPPRKFGGVTEASFNLSKNLVAMGHDVSVYTTDAGNAPGSRLLIEDVVNLEGIKVRYFKNISNFLAFKHQIYLPKDMVYIIKKELQDFDIIHFQDFRSLMHVAIWYYAQKFSIPYVLQSYGYLGHKFERVGLKKIFDYLFGYKILSGAQIVISGKLDLDEYKQMGIDPEKIRVLTNPLYNVDSFRCHKSINSDNFKFNKHFILFLGRLHKIKGIEFLLQGFNSLCNDRDDVILLIAGPDEGYKSVLDQQISKFGINDKIIFTGILTGDDKIAALSEADMLVQTSIYERGPGSPFEAVLCGTPVVVTRNTGAGDIVRKIDAGFLVDYGDVEGLKKAMEEILDKPEKALKKVEYAKKYIINNLSWNNGIKEYENVYKEIMAKCYE
ncbi:MULTISPECIES: glycosyltransferase family 4 protein [Methanobacterium]|uniref:Glycosyl transferase family 1 n=1 Tax=Methanobacterium bryantii TaxID=2161 RepID=A0A2A2H3K4_METBR|nr:MULTISPECIES: glycosyltransferase family 4 protein [Methanobacterium]OEC86109.1 hypothetical protein A9507_11695 [Methanobacterium sp. A39]PAV03904.1 hypothetical protein ASJ80_02475 [Methanobacterium bryantii]